MNSQLIRATRNITRENLAIAIGCGIVLAGLALAFIIQATN